MFKVEFDEKGNVSKEWLKKHSKAEDWNNGLLLFPFENSIMIINRNRQLLIYEGQLITRNKGCWTIVDGVDKTTELLIDLDNNYAYMFSEDYLDLFEKIYQNPLEIDSINLASLFEKCEYDNEYFAILITSLIKLGENSYIDRMGVCQEHLEQHKNEPNNPMAYIKASYAMRAYPKIKNDLKEYKEIVQEKFTDVIEKLKEADDNLNLDERHFDA